MFRTLLVPLDGSPFGEQALPWAVSIARRVGARLLLVQVHTPLTAEYVEALPYFHGDPLEPYIEKQRKEYLDGIRDRVQRETSVPTAVLLTRGEIPAMLRAAARNEQADLIVMTTHARGAMGRFWLGSVADELVRDCPVPLLLVRPTEQALDLKTDPPMRHFLLPLDGTALAEQMLEPATALGALVGADYTLMRVIKPVLPAVHSRRSGTLEKEAESLLEQVARTQHQLQADAQDYLERVAARLRDRGCTVQTRVAVEVQPAAAILHEAAASKVNLIALETHGRRGLARLLLGSVADKVLRGSSVPVLVHRPTYT
jgi:nucleotide-binding universal stress UspA family protein